MRIEEWSFETGTEADIGSVAMALIPPFEPRVICIHDALAIAPYPDCPHDVVYVYDSLMDDEEILLLGSRGVL